MTVATPPKASQRSRSHVRHSRSLERAERRVDRGVLGRYTDHRGRSREVVARPAHAGSVLVIDRDARTLGDLRLVAHLGADEPPQNADIVCRHYLGDPRGRWCRPVAAEDLQAPDPDSDRSPDARSDPRLDLAADHDLDRVETGLALADRQGCSYRLARAGSRLSIPELRWLRLPAGGIAGEPQPVSVREVIACLESYEPVRARTARALARHRADLGVSVAVLRAELERMNASRIVLNRGLRDAVLHAVRTQGLSMSQIALRCGRVKYDARGNASGETSWLARRVGISPEGGECEPTPWVHSDVLALIARAGLGISPREVELG
jgi:hypothetical protein